MLDECIRKLLVLGGVGHPSLATKRTLQDQLRDKKLPEYLGTSQKQVLLGGKLRGNSEVLTGLFLLKGDHRSLGPQGSFLSYRHCSL